MASAANNRFLDAAGVGDLDAVKKALSNGANIEAVRGSYKDTALIVAARSGHKVVVDYLINHGSSIEAQDIHNDTALIVAAQSGHKNVVKYLIRQGANIEAQDINGWTALIAAARNGHDQVVNVLSNGANVNTQSNHGSTALMLAALQGYKGAVEVLLSHGVDISIKNSNGSTALDFANNQKHPGPETDYPAIIKILSIPPAATPEISAQNSEVDSLKQEIIALTSELDSFKQKITDLRSEVDSRKEENTPLKFEVESLKQENTTLTSEVDFLKQKNTTLTSENNSLKDKLMELEELFDMPTLRKQVVLDETEEQMMSNEEDLQGPTIDDFGLSDDQLNELIVESDMFYLARCFGAWTLYTRNPGLQLTPGDQHTIIADPNLVNNQMKMKKGLMMWQSSNPILATFRSLLQILLTLEEGNVAMKISQYIKSSIFTGPLRIKNNTLATEAVNISSEVGSLTSEVGATPCEVDDLTIEGGPTTSTDFVVASDEDTQSVQNCNLTTEVGALKSEVGILLAALDTLKSQVTTLTSENDFSRSEQKNRKTTFGELEADTAEEQTMMELQELPVIPLTSAEEPNITETSSNPAHGCCVMM